MIAWFRKRRCRLEISVARSHSPAVGVSRVEWTVNGTPLWFESGDAGLVPSPEAIACLAQAAASLKGQYSRPPEPVCPGLVRNLAELETIWNGWWKARTGRLRLKTRDAPLPAPAPGVACFLSLGADSFHTALTDPAVDTVVYVGGFDVPLDDTRRLEIIERHFRSAAAEMGKTALFLRSNLRVHPDFKNLSWEKGHGAALAAAAHVLSAVVGRAVISSSFPKHLFKPWGTSWKTDALWSSSAVALEHAGHEFTRFQKIERIAGNPVVQAHLHVCWEHRNDRYNCGECEKCRRTMLGLLALGRLADFKTMPDETALMDALRTAEPLVPHIWPTYRSFIGKGLPESVAAEVRALLRRSGDT